MTKTRATRMPRTPVPRRPTHAAGETPSDGPPAGADQNEKIGLRIRHARMTRGLRLREVAAEAGCSESLLSKIENDKLLPSLSVLRRISMALGLTIGELFAQPREPTGVVTRAGERMVVTMDPLRQGFGIQMERLIPYDQGHLLQGSIHVVAPGGGGHGLITHAGEEVGYIIEGQLELFVGDQTYHVVAGDSFCFRSEIPHGYRNPGPGPTRAIVINTPPTF